MQREEVGPQTIERLANLDTGGCPVLSIYLNLDPSEYVSVRSRESQLHALLGHARRRADTGEAIPRKQIEADTRRVEQAFRHRPELMQGAHGLAVFSSAGAELLEIYGLPDPVTPMAVIDAAPWVEPLAAYFVRDRIGVAVIGRRRSRLFAGGIARLHEFARVEDDIHRRHKQGGQAQARYQRGIEEGVAEHVRSTANALSREHMRAPFTALIVVASDELTPLIDAKLKSDLRRILAATIRTDLDHASHEQVRAAVTPAIERIASEREAQQLDRLDAALATGGRAAAGAADVAAALALERVDTLLVPVHPSRANSIETERAVELALRQASAVTVVSHDPGRIDRIGGIAALLRW